jgi:hypothetical protein
MMNRLKFFIKKHALNSGQAFSEYAPIIGGAGVMVIVAATVIGGGIANVYTNVNCTVENRNASTCVEEVADSEVPGGEVPGGEVPGDETPGDETPGDETPGDETPGDEVPGGEVPGDETPGDETPGDETPGDEVPGDEEIGGEIIPDDVPVEEEIAPEDIVFCEDLLINMSFEEPVFDNNPSVLTWDDVKSSLIPGWNTTASDKKIELWESGFDGYSGIMQYFSYEGNQHAELNGNMVSTLYQKINGTVPGTELTWRLAHRGRLGKDTMNLLIGKTLNSLEVQKTMTTDKYDWEVYSGTYVVPAGQTTSYFAFQSVSAAGNSQTGGVFNPTYGNFLDSIELGIPCD